MSDRGCAGAAELTAGETVQLLIHGATYNQSYWDFGTIDGVSCSYARDIAAAGYPTFAIDEIGGRPELASAEPGRHDAGRCLCCPRGRSGSSRWVYRRNQVRPRDLRRPLVRLRDGVARGGHLPRRSRCDHHRIGARHDGVRGHCPRERLLSCDPRPALRGQRTGPGLSDHREVATEEAPGYAPAAQLRACVVPNSGHDINLALNHDLEEAARSPGPTSTLGSGVSRPYPSVCFRLIAAPDASGARAATR
jgi:hypothetical protein